MNQAQIAAEKNTPPAEYLAIMNRILSEATINTANIMLTKRNIFTDQSAMQLIWFLNKNVFCLKSLQWISMLQHSYMGPILRIITHASLEF